MTRRAMVIMVMRIFKRKARKYSDSFNVEIWFIAIILFNRLFKVDTRGAFMI